MIPHDIFRQTTVTVATAATAIITVTAHHWCISMHTTIPYLEIIKGIVDVKRWTQYDIVITTTTTATLQ